jgi:tellurite methyltransferase
MSPSPFVAEWAAVVGRRRTTNGERLCALDIAMGRGRHALPLARAGFKTFGVDIRHDAVLDSMRAAATEGLTIHGWCADLTTTPLPLKRFELIVVTRYLQRDLFPVLIDTLAPGGVIIYETFTVAQRAYRRGPTSPEHLLEPGELRRRFEGLEVLFEEEVVAPEAVARIAARRRSG